MKSFPQTFRHQKCVRFFKKIQVDERFISLIGVCLGAGYVLAAASEISILLDWQL